MPRASHPSRLSWTLLALAGVALALSALRAPASLAQDAAPLTAGVRARVRVVVVGDFPTRWVQPVLDSLERDLGVEATLEPAPIPLPRAAYYAPRRRYRAEILADALAARIADAPAETRALGLTSSDISTTAHGFHDWGILGLANDVPGRAAIVSSFRVRRRARGEAQARFRLVTTAVHEAGHVLGLPHCSEARCLMRDAEGTMDTVDEGDGSLGPNCTALLDRVAPRRLERSP